MHINIIWLRDNTGYSCFKGFISRRPKTSNTGSSNKMIEMCDSHSRPVI